MTSMERRLLSTGAAGMDGAPNMLRISEREFRQWWIGEARKSLSLGYKGIFIDDVNLVMNLTDGRNH